MTDLKPYTPPFDLSSVNSNKIASDFKVSIQERPNVPYRNPNANLEKLVEEQTEQIEKIRYENMKLNAQIDVLNKTADSKDEIIDDLHSTVSNLTKINDELIKNNRYAMRNGIIIGIIPVVLSIILTVILTYYGLL